MSNPVIPITSAPGYTPYDSTAQWNQSGTLVILLNNTANSNVTYIFSFLLINPMKGQISPPIYIASSSCYLAPYINDYGHLVQAPCQTTVIAQTLLGQGPGDFAPLLVVFFESQSLYQSSSDQVRLSMQSHSIAFSVPTLTRFSSTARKCLLTCQPNSI